MKAKDIMTTDVLTAKPEMTVEEVGRLLMEHNISGVPVINDDNEVIGMVTEGDLIIKDKKIHVPAVIPILDGVIFLGGTKKMEEELRKAIAFQVKDLMTTKVITAGEDTPVEELATTMVEKRINRIPIVREGKLVGLVSRADLVKILVNK